MHADRHHARYAPTAMGALMDPEFLRRAANDACAPVPTGDRESARWRGMLATWRAEAVSLSAYLREWHAGRHS